jgi:hypothetical protein
MKLKKLIKIINKENAPPDGWRPEDKVPIIKHQAEASSTKILKHQASRAQARDQGFKHQA